MMKQSMRKAQTVLRYTSLIQYFFLIVLLMGLILFASAGYAAVNEGRNDRYETRAQLSYLANKVRAGDADGCIEIRETEHGTMLVLTDRTDTGDFETRFYAMNGILYEEYSAAKDPLSPQKASQVGQTRDFFVQLEDGLLTLQTDYGKICVAVRSPQE